MLLFEEEAQTIKWLFIECRIGISTATSKEFFLH
jgi:hypothetical protein